jgi:hypothetical protein
MTKHRTLALLLAIVMLPACNLRHMQAVSLMKQWGAKCKETADLLAGVKDAASAKAAAPRLDTLVKEMDKLQEQIDRVYDPTEVEPGDERAVMEEVGLNIVQMQRLMIEVGRVGKEPEITEALGDAWKRLSFIDVLNQPGAELE